ncbi:MAG: arginine-tRNA-protein transferase [Acidobacteria bacterium]|nr:arginine-tRNA-protein transferase [Acidobacteriota bacterium]
MSSGTRDIEFIYLNEEFYATHVPVPDLDLLLAAGWRHFGERFYRYTPGFYNSEVRVVMPLRVCLDRFRFSKSQRRCLRRNADLECRIIPAEVTPEVEELFHAHRQRFHRDAPYSLYDFLSDEPEHIPAPGLLLEVREGDTLVAASYFERGEATISSLYGMFIPGHEKRGLGIFTLLKEIEYGLDRGMRFFYPGYAYEGESFYDYKKRLGSLEYFDWQGNWMEYSP